VREKYLKDPGLCSEQERVAVQYDWSEIPTGIKRGFHCYWSLLTLLGVFLLSVDAIYTLIGRDYRYISFTSADKALMGLGCLIMWTTILQFLYFLPPLYAFTMTVQTAVPRILAFLAGFLPIYFAFVFLGVGVFGYKLGMFGTLNLATSSMFAFVNGDSIQPILILMKRRSYVAAVLYGVIFILLTTYLLLNIMIAIVEEAYFLSRKKSRFLEFLMWKNLLNLSSDDAGSLEEEEKLRRSMNLEAKPIADEEDDDSDDEEDEWIQNVYSSTHATAMPRVSPNDLNITAAEEAAEIFMLGKTHWEYSKVPQFDYSSFSFIHYFR
jgi:hypothetical protein